MLIDYNLKNSLTQPNDCLMPKKWIKDKIFNKYQLHKHPYLEKFGHLLTREDLWHINRRSIARATAIGLFSAFIPIPFQMVLAGFLSILMRGNVLLAVALVWITNPLTIGPIFYICHQIGQLVLGKEMNGMVPESSDYFMNIFDSIIGPLLIGSLIVSTVLSVTGYFAVNFIWRLHIIRHIKQRRLR